MVILTAILDIFLKYNYHTFQNYHSFIKFGALYQFCSSKYLSKIVQYHRKNLVDNRGSQKQKYFVHLWFAQCDN